MQKHDMIRVALLGFRWNEIAIELLEHDDYAKFAHFARNLEAQRRTAVESAESEYSRRIETLHEECVSPPHSNVYTTQLRYAEEAYDEARLNALKRCLRVHAENLCDLLHIR